MNLNALPVMLALACAAGSSTAASFDCVTPVFPEYSSNSDGVRRVERQVQAWRKCHAEYRAVQDTVAVARLNDEVNVDMEKWIAATRAYLTRQGVSAPSLMRLEREQALQIPMRSGAYASGKK